MKFSKIKIDPEILELYGKNIHHFINKEKWKLNIFFFTGTTSTIDNIWEKINSAIFSIYNVENDNTNDFDRWNFYIFYVSKEEVGKELKSKIENDKLSCRKIVLENFQDNFTNTIANELIIKHITSSDIKTILNTKVNSNRATYTPIHENIYKLIPKKSILGKITKQETVLEQLNKINENKKS